MTMSNGNADPQSSSSSSSSSSSDTPSRTARIADQLSTSLRRLDIPPHLHSMTAGAGAGLVASIITCPLDVIKTRLQAQHVSKHEGYEGVAPTVKRIWRQSGVRGFYRGLGPTIGGYLPTWGIYFTVYDLVKDKLGNWRNSGGQSYPILSQVMCGGLGLAHTLKLTLGQTILLLIPPLFTLRQP